MRAPHEALSSPCRLPPRFPSWPCPSPLLGEAHTAGPRFRGQASASCQPLLVTSSGGQACPLAKEGGGCEPLGQRELERDGPHRVSACPFCRAFPSCLQECATACTALGARTVCGTAGNRICPAHSRREGGRGRPLMDGEQLSRTWEELPAPHTVLTGILTPVSLYSGSRKFSMLLVPMVDDLLWSLEPRAGPAEPRPYGAFLSKAARSASRPSVCHPTWLLFSRDCASHNSHRPCPRRLISMFN